MRAVILLVFSITFHAMGDAGDFKLELDPATESLAKDLQKTKKSLIEDDIKQRKILSSLFGINKKMKKIVIERAGLEEKRMDLEAATKELAQRILDLETRMKNQKSLMRERLVVIYKLGGQGVARLLFSSGNSAQLERNLKILGIIAKRDLDLIKDYTKTAKDLTNKRKKFVERLARLKELEMHIFEKEKGLLAENKMKEKILDSIRHSKKFAMMRLGELRSRSQQLSLNDESGLLDLLFRPSFFEKKGAIAPPLRGPVIRRFGLVRDEKYDVSWPHKGLFISAPEGSTVKAVFFGKVAYSGVVPGFGHTVILDHGDHYYTVYGNTKDIKVQEGQEIKPEQVIALSGASSDDLGEGLYFEIRHFSEPYDPRYWLKGMNL